MKLAKYWVWDSVTANGVQVRCRGWSDENEAAAHRKAKQIGETMARRIATGDLDTADTGYLYGDRPLPEPVLETLPGGLITRNGYGAAVMNTSALMFLDVDREDEAQAPAALDLFSGLRSLFGKAPEPSAPRPSEVATEMETVARRHNLGLRVYRTAAGFRGIVTNQRFTPGSKEAQQLLTEFRCDPLYIRLCEAQESFRARLTPKPWRCGLYPLPVKYPIEGQAAEGILQDWLRRYQANSARNATCRLVHTIGPEATDPELAALIARHDRDTKANTQMPLA
ncbi:MAG: hypothetical protein JST93_07085 [Acidobacteria bacterium]|nr:hypothetical protein [Acidobacteriota bacterium]